MGGSKRVHMHLVGRHLPSVAAISRKCPLPSLLQLRREAANAPPKAAAAAVRAALTAPDATAESVAAAREAARAAAEEAADACAACDKCRGESEERDAGLWLACNTCSRCTAGARRRVPAIHVHCAAMAVSAPPALPPPQPPMPCPLPHPQVVPRRLRQGGAGGGGRAGRPRRLVLPKLQNVPPPDGARGGTQPAVRPHAR